MGLSVLEGVAAGVTCTDVELVVAGDLNAVDDVMMWTVDGLCIEVECITEVLTVVVGTEGVLWVEVGNGCTVVEFAAGWVADDVMVEAGTCAVECEMVALGKSGRQAPLYGKVIVYCK